MRICTIELRMNFCNFITCSNREQNRGGFRDFVVLGGFTIVPFRLSDVPTLFPTARMWLERNVW